MERTKRPLESPDDPTPDKKAKIREPDTTSDDGLPTDYEVYKVKGDNLSIRGLCTEFVPREQPKSTCQFGLFLQYGVMQDNGTITWEEDLSHDFTWCGYPCDDNGYVYKKEASPCVYQMEHNERKGKVVPVVRVLKKSTPCDDCPEDEIVSDFFEDHGDFGWRSHVEEGNSDDESGSESDE